MTHNQPLSCSELVSVGPSVEEPIQFLAPCRSVNSEWQAGRLPSCRMEHYRGMWPWFLGIGLKQRHAAKSGSHAAEVEVSMCSHGNTG